MRSQKFFAVAAVMSGIGLSGSVLAQEHTMIGCLVQNPLTHGFMLTHVESVSNVIITESTANLAPHVGHKVEITGSSVAGKDPKVHSMQVSAMKHLGGTCP